ncbi:uncharacterized protein I303_100205 [Kwoniella dejecticola CBS 10117]|uniref:Uncharacterized protein n=1 Tax=Kwoniella dejecticola CBS 10117 TaxID=1296121 RepID=A0A1A6AE88_9TREE|nr:uncharacterized protein I303_00208 [Kwoniella dejecticola CBS 10117]OBR88391.1 hypothetical protein I303_00208 [Kwoniella dejecticola CBS 10117]
MPIEVTPTPIHPHSLPPVNWHSRHGWFSSPSFASGPARVIDILPNPNPNPNPLVRPDLGPNHTPGSILPNGLRNPWAHYNGETYQPASESIPYLNANIANATAASQGSVIASRSLSEGRAGMTGVTGVTGSVIAPSFVGSGNSNSNSNTGGFRDDDGWNRSMGRNHLGHLPDFSNVGSTGPTPISGLGGNLSVSGSGSGGVNGWMPSSYVNHARMTPTVAPGLAGSVVIYPPSPMGKGHGIGHPHAHAHAQGYAQPGVASTPAAMVHGHGHRRRRSSLNAGVEGCEGCMISARRGRKVSFSTAEPSPLRRVHEVRTS